MGSKEVLDKIQALIDYCKTDDAKRSEIIKRLKAIIDDLNSILPFD